MSRRDVLLRCYEEILQHSAAASQTNRQRSELDPQLINIVTIFFRTLSLSPATCLKKSQDAFRQRNRLSEKCAIVTILNIFNYFYCVYSCEEKSERCSSYNDNLWSKHQHHYHHSPHSLFSILSCNLRVVGLVS